MPALKTLIGKPPIHPVPFYLGKVSGYVIWGILFLSIIGKPLLEPSSTGLNPRFAYFIFASGLLISVISVYNLGRSTRFGLPVNETRFKKGGLYKFSRNPMYLGFDLMSLAAMLYFMKISILFLGVFCIIIYHLIILSEERFLGERFGREYLDFKSNVRRYI